MNAQILNFPPSTRANAAGMVCFGVLPHGVKDYNNLLRVLLEPYADIWEGPQGGGGGLQVYNAHTKQHEYVRFRIVLDVEDSKGLPRMLGHHHQPGYVGVCPYCALRGVRTPRTTYYAGAVAWATEDSIKQLARTTIGSPCSDHSLVGLYKKHFRDLLASGSKPASSTLRTINRSLEALQESGTRAKDVPFVTPCVLRMWNPLFDPTKQCLVGPAHSICNFVLDAVSLVLNDGQMSMRFGNDKDSVFEQSVGRSFTPRSFHASEECKLYINGLLAVVKCAAAGRDCLTRWEN